MEIIKVSARSRSTAVAGAIAGVIREKQYAEVQAIGASAVNQALKATAIACGYLQEDDITIACVPVFTDVMIQGLERTAIKLVVWVISQDVLPPRLVQLLKDEQLAKSETTKTLVEELES